METMQFLFTRLKISKNLKEFKVLFIYKSKFNVQVMGGFHFEQDSRNSGKKQYEGKFDKIKKKYKLETMKVLIFNISTCHKEE